MAGTDLALPDTETAAALSQGTFYHRMDAQQLAVIKATVGKGLNDEELAFGLELAARLDLNPLAKEIWFTKGNSVDGGGGRLMILVGRDGLLKVARRTAGYRGFDADVVHEKDEFRRVAPDGNGKTLRERAGVVHLYGHPARRGAIVGAWCAAEIEGQPPRFFYAAWDEYVPNLPADKFAKSAWGKHPSVMIDKVALSVAHRTLCSITGVHLEEEVARELYDTEAQAVEADERVPYPDGPLGERLRRAVDGINALEPNSYTAATLQMMLAGQDEDVLVKIASDLEDELAAAVEAHEAKQPPEAEIVEAVPEPPEALPFDADTARARLSDLYDRKLAAEEEDPNDEALDDIHAEIDHIEEQLRARGGDVPGQAGFDL